MGGPVLLGRVCASGEWRKGFLLVIFDCLSLTLLTERTCLSAANRS